jgi:hypothetical protein
MNPFAKKLADEIAEMWQCKALRVADGKLRRVMLVVFAKEYAGALPILLRVAFPGFEDIGRPMLVSYAKIMPTGCIVCDMIDSAGMKSKVVVYDSVGEFKSRLRRFADSLKLNDDDREEMFAVVQKWVVADLRIDHERRRLAS